jgi:hypothetical protein
MGYTQEKKTNILRCFGCAKQCNLSIKEVVIDDTTPEKLITDNTISFIAPFSFYIPQINGADITEFTDINNTYHSYTKCPSPEEAIELLRKEILPACDNYKHRNQR